MTWFTKLCRDVGLMVHNIGHPDSTHKQVLRKKVEEEKRGQMTLRRTTIEEIEIKKPDN